MKELELYVTDPVIEKVYWDIVNRYPKAKANTSLFMEKFREDYADADGVFMYYDDAIDFLKKYDPSLELTIELAYDLDLRRFNSVDLANCLIEYVIYNVATERSIGEE